MRFCSIFKNVRRRPAQPLASREIKVSPRTVRAVKGVRSIVQRAIFYCGLEGQLNTARVRLCPCRNTKTLLIAVIARQKQSFFGFRFQAPLLGFPSPELRRIVASVTIFAQVKG